MTPEERRYAIEMDRLAREDMAWFDKLSKGVRQAYSEQGYNFGSKKIWQLEQEMAGKGLDEDQRAAKFREMFANHARAKEEKMIAMGAKAYEVHHVQSQGAFRAGLISRNPDAQQGGGDADPARGRDF